MTLKEISIIIRKELRIRKNQSNKYIVYFDFVDVRKKNKPYNLSYGVGDTIAQAEKDYANKLKGALIFVYKNEDSDFKDRKEYQLPPRITS